MDTVVARFDSARLHSLGSLQELVYVERCKQIVNFEDLQNVIRDKWLDVNIRQSKLEKPHGSGKSF